MDKKFLGLVVVVGLCAGGLLYYATKLGANTVYTPSELVNLTSDLRRIRVAGKVSPDAIEYSLLPSAVLSFSIVDPTLNPHNYSKVQTQAVKAIPVVYNGAKPDMFATGRDVIVDGSYENGKIIASRLLTQCPSKYEAPTPGMTEKK